MVHAAYCRLRLNALPVAGTKKPLLLFLSRPPGKIHQLFRQGLRALSLHASASCERDTLSNTDALQLAEHGLSTQPHRDSLHAVRLSLLLSSVCLTRVRSAFTHVQLGHAAKWSDEQTKREGLLRSMSRGVGLSLLRRGLQVLREQTRRTGYQQARTREEEEKTRGKTRDGELEEAKERAEKIISNIAGVKKNSSLCMLGKAKLLLAFRKLVERNVFNKREESRTRLVLQRLLQITKSKLQISLLDSMCFLRKFRRQTKGMDALAAKCKRNKLKLALGGFRQVAHKKGWLIRTFTNTFAATLRTNLRAGFHQLERILAKDTQQILLEKIGQVGESLSESSENLSILTQRNLSIDKIWDEKALREKRSLLLYVFARLDLGFEGKLRKCVMRMTAFAANVKKTVPLLDMAKRVLDRGCAEGFARMYRCSVMNLEKELVAAIRQFKADAITLSEETSLMGNAAVQLIEERRRVEEMRNREQNSKLIVQKARYKLGKDSRTRIQYGLILEYWNKWRAKKKRLGLLKAILGNGRDFWLKRSKRMVETWYRKTKELAGYKEGLKVLCSLAENSRKTLQGEAWRNVIDRGFFTEESQLLSRIAYIDRRIEGLFESQVRRKLLTLEGIIGSLFEKKKTKNFEFFFNALTTKKSERPATIVCGTIIQERNERRLLIETWNEYRIQFRTKQAQTITLKRKHRRSLLLIFTLLNYNRCHSAQTKKLCGTLETLLRRLMLSRCKPFFTEVLSPTVLPAASALVTSLHGQFTSVATLPFARLSNLPYLPRDPKPLLTSLCRVIRAVHKRAFVLMCAPICDDMFATTLTSLLHQRRIKNIQNKGVLSSAAVISVGRSISRVGERDGRSAREVGAMLARAYGSTHEQNKRWGSGDVCYKPLSELLGNKVSNIQSPPPIRVLFDQWKKWSCMSRGSTKICELYTHRFEERLEAHTMFRKWAQLSGWEFNNPFRNAGNLSIEDETAKLEKAKSELAEARNTLTVLKERQDKETLVSDRVGFLKARVVRSIILNLLKTRQEKIAKHRLSQWYSKVFLIGFDERFSIPVVDNTLREVQELLYLHTQEYAALKQTVSSLRHSSGKHTYVQQELWRTRHDSGQSEELLRLRNHALQLLQSETDNLQKQLRRLQTESQLLVQGGIEAFEQDKGAGEGDNTHSPDHLY